LQAIRSYLVAAAVLSILAGAAAQAQERDPISFVGHGAFFDADGRQVAPTPGFVAAAQAFYRDQLFAALKKEKRTQFSAFQRQLASLVNAGGQAKLVIDQRALDWLAANVDQRALDARTRGKIGALRFVLEFQLPESGDPTSFHERKAFQLDPALRDKLNAAALKVGASGDIQVLSATINSGQAYVNECMANQVPLPPPIGVLDAAGTSGWKSLGFIPQASQFITGTPAELRVFTSPSGMCFALPRYSDGSLSTVMLDGVICLSKISSKVCFWDNQMGGSTFQFAAGTRIPIGVADAAVDPSLRYQAGGKEIENNPSAGICTDCHAGRNPYIIHPEVVLTTSSGVPTGTKMGDLNQSPLSLPTFAPVRYDPLVAASWPQNALSMSPALVPQVCSDCHTGGGSGGAFPHLSSELGGYCSAVLDNAIARTMPPGAAGSEASNPDVIAFRNWCSSSASSGPSNRGDPHLTTTASGKPITYDFQAAGEFVALRNSSNGFELQTRQTPVATASEVANGYTGLTSCVSVNTAVALRVGKRRVTFQPPPGQALTRERLQLRVDGDVTALPANGLALGAGNKIVATNAGGIDVTTGDGTRVVVSPSFWSSQGIWHLDVEVLSSPAQEGTMAPILAGNWLPLGPGGGSFGPQPASLTDRFTLLNRKFADAWRVKKTTTMFDYGPGSGTDAFTDRHWPPLPGNRCTGPLTAGRPVAKGVSSEVAQRLCRQIKDKTAFQSCVADVQATGETGFVKAYMQTLATRH
jgi:hypothetical protein